MSQKMGQNRQLKPRLKQLAWQLYRLGLRWGVHIIPHHYYAPLPNIFTLEKTKDIWAKKSQLPGIEINLKQQIKTLETCCLPYQAEYLGNPIYQAAIAQGWGQGYGYIEAQALHGVIRYFQPRQVIEIGSGLSTYCLLKALEKNQQDQNITFQLITVDPYASLKIPTLSPIQLQKQPVQTLDITFFQSLKSQDLLFIDSSHTVKPGSDVNYLILEILPRLSSGVIVHFHDIFFPYDYPRNTLQTFFPWMETSLLRAFLINNHRVKILFCLSHLHYDCPDKLSQVFPDYRPQFDELGLRDKYYQPWENPLDQHFPSSIYLQIQ